MIASALRVDFNVGSGKVTHFPAPAGCAVSDVQLNANGSMAVLSGLTNSSDNWETRDPDTDSSFNELYRIDVGTPA